MPKTKLSFSESMKRLEEINRWFEKEDLDLEVALTKLKEGKELIQSCKVRLTEIENEFQELKIDFHETEPPSTANSSPTPKEASQPDDESPDLPF